MVERKFERSRRIFAHELRPTQLILFSFGGGTTKKTMKESNNKKRLSTFFEYQTIATIEIPHKSNSVTQSIYRQITEKYRRQMPVVFDEFPTKKDLGSAQRSDFCCFLFLFLWSLFISSLFFVMDQGRSGVDVLKTWLMEELQQMFVYSAFFFVILFSFVVSFFSFFFFLFLFFFPTLLYSLSNLPFSSSVKPETIASYVIALLKQQNSRGELRTVVSRSIQDYLNSGSLVSIFLSFSSSPLFFFHNQYLSLFSHSTLHSIHSLSFLLSPNRGRN